MAESSLSEEQKLVWLGLRRATRQGSDGQSAITAIQNNFGTDWGTFQDDYEDENPSSYDDFETFLIDHGVGETRAASIRQYIESIYADFSTFDTTIRGLSSYSDFRAEFPTSNELRSDVGTIDGQPAAGVRVYETGGVGRDGQYIEAGGLEIYGSEIHTSQNAADPDTDAPGDTDGDTSYNFEYHSQSISNTTPTANSTITVSCDVTNSSTQTRTETAQLFVDGEVDRSETVTLGPSESTEVSFIWFSGEYDTYEIGIGPNTPETVTVLHPSLS